MQQCRYKSEIHLNASTWSTVTILEPIKIRSSFPAIWGRANTPSMRRRASPDRRHLRNKRNSQLYNRILRQVPHRLRRLHPLLNFHLLNLSARLAHVSLPPQPTARKFRQKSLCFVISETPKYSKPLLVEVSCWPSTHSTIASAPKRLFSYPLMAQLGRP